MASNKDINNLIKKIDELIASIKNDTSDIIPIPQGQNDGDDDDSVSIKKRRKKLEESLMTEEELLDKHYEENIKILEGNEKALKKLNEKYNKDKEELTKKHLEEEKKIREQTVQNFQSGWNTLTMGFNQLMGIAKKVERDITDSYGKADQEATNYGRAIGMTSDKVAELRGNVANFMVDTNMAIKYNLRTDEMIKLMSDYTRGLGRAVGLTHQQMENVAQLNLLMGSDKAVKFTAAFDKFGIGIDAAAQIAENMFNDANRKGISFEQISENFLNNIELAQQYTFENGIEGLKKMAESATTVKWNMQQTAAFADKVSNIEGAIKTSAQLSVLGGPFAQFSNPMGMLYESLNNLEGLQDRIFAMFGKLGEWNTEKGMVDISVFNKQRIKAAAEAMGLNYGDIINTVNQQARRGKVLDNIKNLGFDKDTQELIANTAQLDKNGEAYVTIDGEKKYVKNGLTDDDKSKLVAKSKSDSETLKDIAINSKSLLEHQQAVEKQRLNLLTQFYNNTGIGEKMDGYYELLANLQKYLLIIQGATLVIQGLVAAKNMLGGLGQMLGYRGGMGGALLGPGGASGVIGKSNNTLMMGGNFGKLGTFSNGKALITKYGSASSARNSIRWNNAAKGLGIASMVGSMGFGMLESNARNKGDHEKADKYAEYQGAATGVGMASLISSNPVTLALGGLLGLAYSHNNNAIAEARRNKEQDIAQEKEMRAEEKEQAKRRFYEKTGIWLNGDYSVAQIERWMTGSHVMGTSDYEILRENGDENMINNIPRYMKNGGVLDKGSTHSEGGMNVVDNRTGEIIAEVEKNEGIVPVKIMEKFGTVDNLINNAMKPLQPMGEQLQISHNNPNINHSLSIGGLANVNVEGAIQIQTTNGQTYNITEDPIAMKQIGDNIMKHIMLANDRIFNKNEYYRKW